MHLYLVGVQAQDEPGALAKIARQMATNRVNLQGFLTQSDGVKMLTKDVDAARRALEVGGYDYNVTEVHEVVLENRPGALATVCERLYDAGVNIETAFGLTLGNDGRVFIRVSDLDKAAPIIANATKSSFVEHPGLHRVGAAPSPAPAPNVVRRAY